MSSCKYWYILDGRGNVVALTDTTGSVVDRYSYDVWGVPAISLETVRQPLLYAGYWYDRELGTPNETTGWYWLSVRSYDPVLKRFLQPDPSGLDGLRSYVYVGDNPVDGTDPTGLWYYHGWRNGGTSAEEWACHQRQCYKRFHLLNNEIGWGPWYALDAHGSVLAGPVDQSVPQYGPSANTPLTLVINHAQTMGLWLGTISTVSGTAAAIIVFVPGGQGVAGALAIISWDTGEAATVLDALAAKSGHGTWGTVVLDATSLGLGKAGEISGKVIEAMPFAGSKLLGEKVSTGLYGGISSALGLPSILDASHMVVHWKMGN